MDTTDVRPFAVVLSLFGIAASLGGNATAGRDAAVGGFGVGIAAPFVSPEGSGSRDDSGTGDGGAGP